MIDARGVAKTRLALVLVVGLDFNNIDLFGVVNVVDRVGAAARLFIGTSSALSFQGTVSV